MKGNKIFRYATVILTLWLMIEVVFFAEAQWWRNIHTLTVKTRKPLSFMPKDLNKTYRKLSSGGTLLLAEEGFGAFRHALFADLDGDGLKEVIATDDNGLVLALQNDGAEIWRYDTNAGIEDIIAEDLDSDGKTEIILAANFITVLDYRGKLRWMERRWRIHALALMRGENEKRIVAIGEKVEGTSEINGVVMFSATGEAIWFVETGEGVSQADALTAEDITQTTAVSSFKGIAVGNLIGDSRDEIAVSTGENLYFMTNTGEIIRAINKDKYGYWPSNFLIDDLDGGGLGEVITSHGAFNIYGRRIWQGRGTYYTPVATGDMDADGKKEVVHDNWGILCANSEGKQLWKLNTPGIISNLVMVDLNKDGADEIIASGYSFLCAIDKNGSVLWTYDAGCNYTGGLAAADADGDGDVEIVAAADDLYMFEIIADVDGRYLFDRKGNMRWMVRSNGGLMVAMGDIDADGAEEITTAAGTVTAYDGDGSAKWGLDTPKVSSIALGNLDDDPALEIVVGCIGGSIYVIEGNGELKWQPPTGPRRLEVKIGDIDGDNRNEVVVKESGIAVYSASGERMWKYQPSGKEMRKNRRGRPVEQTVYYPILAIAFGNIDDKPGNEVIIRSLKGIEAIRKDGTVRWSYNKQLTKPYELKGCYAPYSEFLTVFDLQNDGKPEVLTAGGGRLYCLNQKGKLQWQTEHAASDMVKIADLDGDGNMEIITAYSGIAVFNASGELQWDAPTQGVVRELLVGDVNFDRKPEIVVRANAIQIFAADGAEILNYNPNQKIEGIAVGDISGDGTPVVTFGASGVYVLRAW